jgi:hypothetical protein
LAATIENYREARAAFGMIRQVVQAHAPAESMQNEEMLPPDFALETEELIKGILAIVARRKASASDAK